VSGHGSLIVVAEVHGILARGHGSGTSGGVLISGVSAARGGSVGGVDVRWVDLAVHDDCCAALATTNLGESVLDLLVGDGVLGTAGGAGKLHSDPWLRPPWVDGAGVQRARMPRLHSS